MPPECVEGEIIQNVKSWDYFLAQLEVYAIVEVAMPKRWNVLTNHKNQFENDNEITRLDRC